MVQLFGVIAVYYILDQAEFKNNFTYLVVGSGFLMNSLVEYSVGDDIKNGKFSTHLMRPANIFGYYFVRALGTEFLENIIKVVLYAMIIVIAWPYFQQPSFANLLSFVLCIPIVYLIHTFVGLITGFIAFWINPYYGAANFVGNATSQLSGSVFKLDKLIPIQPLCSGLLYLPFAFTFYYPMQIFLGKENNPLWIIFAGVGWCLFLWILARYAYRAGLKKYEAVGL